MFKHNIKFKTKYNVSGGVPGKK